jgi:hypothetical protein
MMLEMYIFWTEFRFRLVGEEIGEVACCLLF